MGEPDIRRRRRSRGEGGVHWDEKRQRFIATETVGWTPAGKRIVKRGSGKSEAQARANLRDRVREYKAGLTPEARNYTVRHAVEDWLAYGLPGRSPKTVEKNSILCRSHVIPGLGARKLRELSAADVDRWLEAKAKTLSTRTLGDLFQCLNRVVKRAMARDLVARNVVELCGVPRGQPGRRSKSLTLDQTAALLAASESSTLHAYVVLSVMIGARTEELRALRWDHVDLDGQPDATPPVPPSVLVWRSVREGGDTKTKKSRRTLALPRRCVDALRRHLDQQKEVCARAGRTWSRQDLVFATRNGTALSAGNVRRSFRQVVGAAGLDSSAWTPRELRHSFVSLMSAHGVTVEQIADLVGHAGTTVTEAVYRHELRPVLLDGARIMDTILGAPGSLSGGRDAA